MFETFKCLDCTINTHYIDEYYMLCNDVWLKINPLNKGMLCLGCAEERLNRKLQRSDFIDMPINLGFFPRSDRFLNRMGIIKE